MQRLQEPPTRRMVSRTITELIFAGTNLSIQGADAVGRAIKHIKGLRVLDVRDCSLVPGVMERFCQGLGEAELPRGLTTFWIGGNWNSAGEDCSKALCDALVGGDARSLTSLDLENSIMPRGGQYISEMLVIRA